MSAPTCASSCRLLTMSRYLAVTCSVETVEKLFSVSMEMFEHETIDVENGPFHHVDRVLRTHDELTLPADISSRIEFIHGINDLPCT